jgi:uncharacterized protein (TIRG00374 family)
MTKHMLPLIKFLVTVGLLLWIGSKVAWDQVATGLLSLGWQGWLAAALLISLQNALAAWRWRLILHSLRVPIPWWRCLRYFYVGLLLNQTLPASVGGDVARVWLLKRDGQDLGNSMHSIILDRLFPLLSLLSLILLTMPQWVRLTGQTIIAQTFSAIALGIVAVLVVLIVTGERIASPKKSLWIGNLQRFLLAFHACLRHPRDLLPPLLAGIVGFCVMSALVSTLAYHMSISLDFWTCLILCPPVFLIASLPISIAGWGVREGAMVLVLGYVAIPPDRALPLSIALGLILLAGALPGVLCLWHLNLRKKLDIDSPQSARINS